VLTDRFGSPRRFLTFNAVPKRSADRHRDGEPRLTDGGHLGRQLKVLITYTQSASVGCAGAAQPTFLAASAPFLPNAVRVLAGKWEMVFLDFAAVAAFLMFFLAAARCFSVLIALQSFLTDLAFLGVRLPFSGRFGPRFHHRRGPQYHVWPILLVSPKISKIKPSTDRQRDLRY
jgi:hypothetical protein